MAGAVAVMKILYVIAEMEDFWSSRLPVALGAQERGYEVCVAFPGAASDARLKEYGIKGFDLPPARQKFSAVAAMQLTRKLDRIMKDLQPDIMHAITLKYAFITALAARRHKKIKPVYTIAGLGYLFSGESLKPKILRTLLRPVIHNMFRHSQIIVQNPDDLETLAGRGFIKRDQAALVRGSGVDLNRYKPVHANDADPVIIMPTRLVHDKGLHVFIEAARILKQRGVQARFQIAGGVTRHNPRAISREEMEFMLEDSNVEWLGKISDMPALYAASTLIVYPSYYGEGIPRVLLEAAAAGRAMVTTDHPGCREAVSHNDNGLLVPVKDAAATADAVEKLLKDTDLRRKMEQRSRARAESEFDIRLIVRQTLDVYSKI
jgi:glycosyltransferase involved in cell wall biosynthesis